MQWVCEKNILNPLDYDSNENATLGNQEASTRF